MTDLVSATGESADCLLLRHFPFLFLARVLRGILQNIFLRMTHIIRKLQRGKGEKKMQDGHGDKMQLWKKVGRHCSSCFLNFPVFENLLQRRGIRDFKNT